ncbi:UDP-4-amino-4,6-dideoxy-N-acetyl-beta-L-altrosamine transaminase [Heliorestis acidaminivorans]|uniref:UDP-4-amino-4, 6-dideoxy-N-acetyl-beta-L-altrosamine transaminase n=1 Tax=Heliorestis acidaminivorans TaxID=553427 RepID=A0A6I0F178_9FIRM|nr:UDP-4-amino-4,6-dideoxy-N-acetyl-beta-L-altrosamine transaminase [Heliorestis acidaminivorans]KAB2952937.1 UDP-4-amino-4,6-dideoxy-N-acetyl-beta-L-altrosamine transaminase [Heliorestis acidaminivorans]
MRDTLLPYGKQWLDEQDIEAVVEVLKSDYLTTGPTIELFEKAFASYVGAEYAIAFSNGTAALHGACFAAGITKGYEVITTPMTFAATANCILYQGGTPIFADIDKLTYNIEPMEIERKISKNTKAIIPVDFAGQPAKLDEIKELAKKHNLIVIEDAAHALGAMYKGRKVGSISDMSMFSLHPVKHITTGEGGIITTNNKEYYSKLRQFRSHGITREKDLIKNPDEPWYYEMHFLGYNYRMTDIQAALGISQLKKADKFIELRRNYAAMYKEAFTDIEQLILPTQNRDTNSSWHLFIIQLRLEQLSASRKQIIQDLLDNKIGVNVHYIPVYYHPYYQELGYTKGLCPNAEALYASTITLPLFPKMTTLDVKNVIETVKKTIKNYV